MARVPDCEKLAGLGVVAGHGAAVYDQTRLVDAEQIGLTNFAELLGQRCLGEVAGKLH